MKTVSTDDITVASATAVVGSRGWHDRSRVFAVLDLERPSHIVTGGAAGADSFAMEWASLNRVACDVIRPDYAKHGRHAPHVRNRAILLRSANMIAFWDGTSPGTARMISSARKAGKNVKIYS